MTHALIIPEPLQVTPEQIARCLLGAAQSMGLCSHLERLMSRIDLSTEKRQRGAMRKASHRMRRKIQNRVKVHRFE